MIYIDKPMPLSCEDCFLSKHQEVDVGAEIKYQVDCKGNIIQSGWGRRVDCPLKEQMPVGKKNIIIDDYLGLLIKKSKQCKRCALRHENNICYFASDCYPDHKWFTEKEN